MPKMPKVPPVVAAEPPSPGRFLEGLARLPRCPDRQNVKLHSAVMVGKRDGGHMTPDDQRALDDVAEVADSSGVNPRSMLAPYVQIALLLRGSIVTRSLPVGSPLPSDSELVERYGVSRETVRRAVALLRALGLAETRQGVGSVVARTPEVLKVSVAPGSRVVVRMPRPGELPEGLGYAVYVVTEPGKEPVVYDTGSTLLVFE
jgi:hypothetical protein